MNRRVDYYVILGVARDCDGAELKRAYRELAWKYHPDQNPDSPDAESKFKEISEAYAVLSDPEQRRRYDRGEATFPVDFASLSELLDGLLAELKWRRPKKERGRDLRYTLEIDFLEAARGVKKTIEFAAHGDCTDCRGSGGKGPDGVVMCSSCRGRGEVKVQQGLFSLGKPCGRCAGRGAVVTRPCETCKGTGAVERMRSFDVTVPAGCEDGATKRIAGQGDLGKKGGTPGDLHVLIRVKPHPLWKREGQVIVCELPISPAQAAVGATVLVPTIDGKIEMKIPPGTQTGALFRLRGRGLGENASRRDAHVRVVVETPSELSERQRQLFAELDASFSEAQLPKTTAYKKSL